MPVNNVPVGTPVPTSDLSVDQAEIQRRLQMADILQQQALSAPPNQTVGGVVLKQSPVQGFARLAQALAANKIREGADASTKELASQQQARMAQALQTYRDTQDPTALINSGHPALMQSGLQMLQQKPIVVGRSLVDPRTNQIVATDATWKEEQEAARKEKGDQFKIQQQNKLEADQRHADLMRELAANRSSDASAQRQNMMAIAQMKQEGKQDPKQMAAYSAGLKELQKDDQQVASASALENAYKEWQDLQAKVDTGPIAGRRPISFNPDFQRMKQLENYLAMNNFKPGQGQISNFERELVKGSGPNTLNSAEANNTIVGIGLGAAQNMRDRANFREQWLQQKGNLLGSDQAWQKYLNDNPRYTKDKSGKIVPNANRTEWMDYFGGKQVEAKPADSGNGGWSIQKVQ